MDRQSGIYVPSLEASLDGGEGVGVPTGTA